LLKDKEKEAQDKMKEAQQKLQDETLKMQMTQKEFDQMQKDSQMTEEEKKETEKQLEDMNSQKVEIEIVDDPEEEKEGDPQPGQKGEPQEGEGKKGEPQEGDEPSKSGDSKEKEGEEEEKDSKGSEEGEEKEEGQEGEGEEDSKGSGEGEDDESEAEGEETDEEKELKAKLKELTEKQKELEKEIENSKSEIEKSKSEIEKAKKELKKAEKESQADVDKMKTYDPTAEFEKQVEEYNDKVPTDRGDVIPLPLFDYVYDEKVNVSHASNNTKEVLRNVMCQLSALTQRFIQKVRSSRHAGSRTYQGRISTKRLHKYRHSQNIFKTEMLRKKHTAAVSIIIDCSGSMKGGKIATARRAALVIGEMMHQGKINFTLNGFTVPFSDEFDFGCYTRHSNLIHYRFGSSNDWDMSKHAVLNGDLNFGLQDNDDGESLRHFAAEIKEAKEERKIMIVLSDGEPASRAQYANQDMDLRKVIKEIRQSGIEIYSIGLGHNSASYYGAANSVNLSARASDTDIVTALTKFVGLISNG